MKFLVAILALLISVSAFAQYPGHRGRYLDAHGVPYGGYNPPVYAYGGNAHCYYSVYACSGAGGSLGPHGYRVGRSPYGHGGHGGYPRHGNHQSRGGSIGVYNGQVFGSFYWNQSRTK